MDNYNSPRKSQRCESTRWILEKINAKDKTFSKSEKSKTTIQITINYRNETQAIDSESKFYREQRNQVQAIKSIR